MPRRLTWRFDQEQDDLKKYMESCRRGKFEYCFSASVSQPVLYGSAYAFMINSMIDGFENEDSVQAWIDHFDAFQSDDGLFRDPLLAGDAFEHRGEWGEGWGARHLAAHMIIPYARAGRMPRREFGFLEPLYKAEALENWLSRFHFRDNLWSQSNFIMNLYSVLQYERDARKNADASACVEKIKDWLRQRQNPQTGLWHENPLETRSQKNDAIRAAYHYYPLFEYDREPSYSTDETIDVILQTQNSWGAFEHEERPAGACEDIDALDPLLRFSRRTGYRRNDVKIAAERSLVWVLSCKNADGGSSSMPEHGFAYGAHPLTTSQPGESNLFASWFRTLTLAYLCEFLELDNGFHLGRYPGYEIKFEPSESNPRGGRQA
ncbi:MAG: hypothetical protein AAF437_11370 [Pseudomonadota bacterium]